MYIIGRHKFGQRKLEEMNLQGFNNAQSWYHKPSIFCTCNIFICGYYARYLARKSLSNAQILNRITIAKGLQSLINGCKIPVDRVINR